MMTFLKYITAALAIGCLLALGNISLAITAAFVLCLFTLISYLRKRKQHSLEDLAASTVDLNIKPYVAPIMLKTFENVSKAGSHSSVAPMNRVNPNQKNVSKAGMKSSMM